MALSYIVEELTPSEFNLINKGSEYIITLFHETLLQKRFKSYFQAQESH
jgi:hypothetical protein